MSACERPVRRLKSARSELQLLAKVLAEPWQQASDALTDWPQSRVAEFTLLAREHGVEAWLAAKAPLAEPGWALLADQRPKFLAAQARTVSAARHFGALVDGRHLPWLVLKGPALAHSVYPRPDLRHYVDLDLLVSPSDFSEVLSILDSAGYQLIDRNWPLLERYQPGELRLRSPRGVLIDLHWSIFNDAARRAASGARTDVLLKNRRVLDRVQLPALSSTDQLVHLGLHGALSGANRLGWLLDVHLAVQAGIDWQEVAAAAGRMGAGPSLALVLSRANRILGTEIGTGIGTARLGELAGGRGWLATTQLLDRLSPIQPDPNRPSLARSVARSLRADGRGSVRELARHAWLWLRSGAARDYTRPDWLEADNPASTMRDEPDPVARDRYLRAVGRAG